MSNTDCDICYGVGCVPQDATDVMGHPEATYYRIAEGSHFLWVYCPGCESGRSGLEALLVKLEPNEVQAWAEENIKEGDPDALPCGSVD